MRKLRNLCITLHIKSVQIDASTTQIYRVGQNKAFVTLHGVVVSFSREGGKSSGLTFGGDKDHTSTGTRNDDY